MVACASGFYQPNKGQGACIGCHAGLHCTDTGYPTNLALRPAICPAGKYCEKEVVLDVSNALPACPAGYYSSS